jgi:hypothetical protein
MNWDSEIADAYLTALSRAVERLEELAIEDPNNKLSTHDVRDFMQDMATHAISEDYDLTMEKMSGMGDLCRFVAVTGILQDKEDAYAIAGDLVLEYVFVQHLKVSEARDRIQDELSEVSIV